MSQNILQLLFTYNPWWTNGTVSSNRLKDFKRSTFYKVSSILNNNSLRRFLLLSGMRRVGKTTILYQLIDNLLKEGTNPKKILYLSLDHPALQNLSIGEILEIYQNNIYAGEDAFLFLDEIHYASDWDKWLKTLYDLYPDIKVIATGSASLALLRGKWESGAGRIQEINVPALSFYEYCCLKGINIEINQNFHLNTNTFNNCITLNSLKEKCSLLNQYFNSYLFCGGFPEFINVDDLDYLQEMVRTGIIENILKKDLPNYYEIRNSRNIERIFYYFCNTSSDIISIDTITKDLSNTSRDTVEKYISYLESAYLIKRNEPIYLDGKKVLKARPKVYVTDTTIQNAMLSSRIENTTPEFLGKLVETTVFNAFSSYFKTSNIHLGFLRGGKKSEREVDLIIQRPYKPEIDVEVKYRNNPIIKKSDLINEVSGNVNIFIITKDCNDFGVRLLASQREALFIPASIFLYILGYAEYHSIDIFNNN